MTARHGTWAAQVTAGLGVTTPLEARLAIAAMLVKDSAGKARQGIFYEGVDKIVTGTSGLAYSVAKFGIAQVVSAADGATVWANDGVVPAAIGSTAGTNTRITIIYGFHRDFLRDGGNSDPVIAAVSGAFAVSPAAPVIPVGAVELARAVEPAGMTATTSATITQSVPFTAMAGGVVYFRNQAEADAFSCPDGQPAYRLDWNRRDVRQKGRWGATGSIALEAIYRNASGYDNVTVSREGNEVRVKGQFANKGAVDFASGTQYLFGKLPTGGFFPGGILLRPAAFNGIGAATGSILVFPNGDLKFLSSAGGTFADGQLSFGFDFTFDAA